MFDIIGIIPDIAMVYAEFYHGFGGDYSYSNMIYELIISPDESRGYIGFRSVAPPPPP